MLSSDKNIQTIRELCFNLKDYFELKVDSLQVDFVSKLSILVAALIIGGIVFALTAIIVLFLSGTVALALAPWVGGLAVACLIVATCYILLSYLIYINRTAWILNPVVNFIGHLFLKEEIIKEEQQDETK